MFSIAYPTIDPSFTYPQHHTAVVGGSTPPLPCPYLPGLLVQYYTVEWWRGLIKLDTSTAKYQILQNFSLVIHDSAIPDVSDGYICKIVVNDIEANRIYTEYGPDISLTVDGKICVTCMWFNIASSMLLWQQWILIKLSCHKGHLSLVMLVTY